MAGGLEFEQLVDAHQVALFRFALSLVRREDDATDLVQETFLIWATKGHQLNDPGKAKTWLFTTLHREFLRRRRREVRFVHEEIAAVEAELPELDPGVARGIDWPLVLDGLAALDETFRAPVALFYLEDNSYNEIAEILDVPLGTVKSRMARGLAQLREELSRPSRNQTRSTRPSR